MKKTALIIIAVLAVGGILSYYFLNPTPKEPEESLISVESPKPNQEIQSPFIVKGEARGYWFFEATFPVKLLDESGNVIKQTYAEAQGEWMTENFVPFESLLNFSVLKDQKGTLVLERDNPSGLPENNAEIRIPVMLKATGKQKDFSETGNLAKDNSGMKPGAWYLIYEKQGAPALFVELKINEDSLCQISSGTHYCRETILEAGDRAQISGWKTGDAVSVESMVIQKTSEQMRAIKLYYYDSEMDKDSSGNIMCSRQGLVAVSRMVPITVTPIQDAIKLLISGNITEDEKKQGISTEYPLQGFSLQSASLSNKILTLSFRDPYNKTSGGSCRAGILWFQIEATAKQFSEVSQVRFDPEYLFQP